MMEMKNSSTIQEVENSGHASSCAIEQNVAGTCGKIDTPLTQACSLDVPANFDLYRRRQELIAKRNAEKDPVKRQRISNLIETMQEHDRAEEPRRSALKRSIADQIQRIQQG